MGGFVPFIGPALSVVGGLFGGDSAPSNNVYQPGGTGQQDANLQGLLNSNTNFLSGDKNPFSVYNPQILQAFQQLFNTPGTAGYASAAGAAGQGYTGVGNQNLNLSQLLSTTSQPAMAGASSVLNMGFDPQKGLYDKLLQQTTDQANVHNAQYGLTGQQAAGGVNQATTDFNLGWQEQELNRALQGLKGYDQTVANVAGVGTEAGNIGTAGAGNILAGGSTPYAAGQTIGGGQEIALQQLLAQLLGPVTSSQSTIGDLAGYMNQGINASASQGNLALQNYYAQLQGASAGAAGGAALGNNIASLFAPSSSSFTPAGAGGAINIADLQSMFDQAGGGFMPGGFG